MDVTTLRMRSWAVRGKLPLTSYRKFYKEVLYILLDGHRSGSQHDRESHHTVWMDQWNAGQAGTPRQNPRHMVPVIRISGEFLGTDAPSCSEDIERTEGT